MMVVLNLQARTKVREVEFSSPHRGGHTGLLAYYEKRELTRRRSRPENTGACRTRCHL